MTRNLEVNAPLALTLSELDAVNGGFDIGGAINSAVNKVADVVNVVLLGKEISNTKVSTTTY